MKEIKMHLTKTTLADYLRDTIGGILNPSEILNRSVVFRLDGIVADINKVEDETRRFMEERGYRLDNSNTIKNQHVFSQEYHLEEDIVRISYHLSENLRDLVVTRKL